MNNKTFTVNCKIGPKGLVLSFEVESQSRKVNEEERSEIVADK